MIEYKDNEAFEKEKQRVLAKVNEQHKNLNPNWTMALDMVNLLKQSVWAGAIKPIPVVRDGNGNLVKRYTWIEWIAKLNEELDEVKYAVFQYEDRFGDSDFDEEDGEHFVAEELQDLITVATSMQESYLGYKEAARDKICAEVNEKNSKRGYHSSGGKSLNSESEMFYIPVERTVSLSVKDIDNIMTTALEGGINYWCGAAEVVGDCIGKYASEQIARGGTLILHDAESNNKWELNRERLLKGFKRWFDDDGAQFAPNGQIDWTSFDANDADCIIQYALFGEIVFG